MSETGDSPNVDEVVQSAPIESLNEGIAPRTDNRKGVFQRARSLIGGKKKDKMIVAQLTKERDQHKASDAAKTELLTTMGNISEHQQIRIAQLEEELKAARNLENLKISGDIALGFEKVEQKLRSLHSEDITRGFEKVEKNLRSLLDRSTEKTIRWRFTNISKLTADPVHSQPTEFAGVSWRIQVRNKDGHLVIYLEADKFEAARSACAVHAELQLISQKDYSILKQHKFEKARVYDGKFPRNGWGVMKFMPFEDLRKGDAVDDEDSILVAVVVKAFPSN